MIILAYCVVIAVVLTPFVYAVYEAWKLARFERFVRRYQHDSRS